MGRPAPHHLMSPDPATMARLSIVIGSEALDAVEARTPELIADQRKVTAIRAVAFAAGFGLAFILGLGWVLIAIGALIHFIWHTDRMFVVAVDSGLALVRLTRKTASLVEQWPAHQRATMVLRRDDPDVTLRIGPQRLETGSQHWSAIFSGLEIDRMESVVQQGKTEVMRTVDNS
ncbi:MAG: hypothetical protein ACI8Y4_000242 [Candidatus Poriferisodalaceae bacterium]|jgi:hypothetical protein